MRKLGWVLLACALIAIAPSWAAVRYVSPTGDDGTDPVNDCTTQGSPCKTIQHAVDVSASDDTIRVFPGTYKECIAPGRRCSDDGTLTCTADADCGDGNVCMDEALDFIADAIENDGLASATTIDGTGVCGGKVCSLDLAASCLTGTDCAEGTCNIPEEATEGTCSNAPAVTCTSDEDCGNPCIPVGRCATAGTLCRDDGDCTDEACNIPSVAPAIHLGDNSSLKGFTVKGGGDSGVRFDGTTSIQQNVITRNASTDLGGGVHGETIAFGLDRARSVVDPERCWGDTSLDCTDVAQCSVCNADHTVICTTGTDCEVVGGDCVSLGPCVVIKEAKLDHNVISGNVADLGGGVYLEVFGAGAGAKAVITTNTITGNSSFEDGGGVYTYSFAYYNGGRVDLQASGNTVSSNLAASYGGGIQAGTFSVLGGITRAAITTNTIEGNSAGVDGGGIAGVVGYPSYFATDDKMDVSGNTVNSNEAGRDGGGIALQLARSAEYGINSVATVTSNTVTGNTASNNGGGMDLYELSFYSSEYGSPAETGLRASKNTVTGNTAENIGGGINSFLLSYYEFSTGALRVEQNTIQGNTATVAGGGASLGTFAIGGGIEKAKWERLPSGPRTEHWFNNNLVLGNRVHNDDEVGVGGGAFAFLQTENAGFATIGVDFGTFLSNHADLGGGALEVEAQTDESGGFAGLAVADSIAEHNVGYALGGPVPGSSGTIVSESTGNLIVLGLYSDSFENTLGDVERTLTDVTSATGSITDDPKLDAAGVPNVCSPTIDAGDPTRSKLDSVASLNPCRAEAAVTTMYPDVSNSDLSYSKIA
ncbi:MAG: hypothetical protein LAO51_13275 [Acidobacteriia bacterium]|nr:hypothetical protein [Terriglobia bacterium]